MAAIAVSRHEKNLRALRCAISHNPSITLHHCHGGSLKERGWHVGVGQKQNPFLQIPINDHYHTGGQGIDSGMGVITWESYFGTQWEHLEWVNKQLDYDLFQQAQEWEDENRPRSIGTKRSLTTDTNSTPSESASATKN